MTPLVDRGKTLILSQKSGRWPDGELSTKAFSNYIYRAYRLPYDWVPQLERPVEEAVIPPANGEFRVSP